MVTRKRTQKPELRNVAAILNRETIVPASIASQSVAVDKIQLPKSQPRRYFDSEKLNQLVQSIKEHGILEPLLVRPLADGDYELVAGERRLRASRELGLAEVPIVVRELDDRQALQVALMENLQREDLNPVEETEAILELLAIALEATREDVISLFYQAHHAKHRGQELGQNVLSQLETIQNMMAGVGRFSIDSFRSSRLPLLNLPEDVLNVLRQGKLEYTKAQAIARVKDKQHRTELLEQAVRDNLPLSEIKARIQALKSAIEESASEEALEKVTAKRWSEIGKRLQKSHIWSDRKKRDRITKLLDELDKLTTES